MIIMWLMHAMPPTISFSGGPPCSEVSGGFSDMFAIGGSGSWFIVFMPFTSHLQRDAARFLNPAITLGFCILGDQGWEKRFFSCVFLEKMQDFWNMRWWNHRFLSLSVLLSMKKLKSSLLVKISLNNFLTFRWKFASSHLRVSNYGTSEATTCRGHFSWQRLRLGEKYLRQFFPCFFKLFNWRESLKHWSAQVVGTIRYDKLKQGIRHQYMHRKQDILEHKLQYPKASWWNSWWWPKLPQPSWPSS